MRPRRACALHASMKRPEQRDALRAGELRAAFLAVMSSEFGVLELYNCPCRSTFSIPGIGPAISDER